MTEMLNAVTVEGPDVVILTGLPPAGMPRLQRLYRSLRSRNPQVRVMFAILKLQEDAQSFGQEIGHGEEVRVFTRLKDACAEVRAVARRRLRWRG